MITATLILGFLLVFIVVRLALKLAWGIIKILFSIGLFAFCPVLFIVLGILGLLGSGWWIIVLIAIVCGVGFGRA